MKDILRKISEIVVARPHPNISFTEAQRENRWLGTIPATPEQIEHLEKSLGLTLPTDYKQFLSICNGFTAPTDIEPSFLPVERVTYLINVDPFLIEVWNREELRDIGLQLAQSIIVAGIDEEQYFLLIPPSSTRPNWKYWTFANWYPGEHEFGNLEAYFNSVLEFVEENHGE